MHASSDVTSSALEGDLNSIEMLLPSALKLNRLMHEAGHTPVHLTTSDVNLELRSMSVFVLDSWAESLFVGVTELMERAGDERSAIKDASISAWQDGMTRDVLQSRITDLQTKLLDSEKRERTLKQQSIISGDRAAKATSEAQESGSGARKRIKNLELLLAEKERLVRQRDSELSKVVQFPVSVLVPVSVPVPATYTNPNTNTHLHSTLN
jgi:hypothetical protein